MMWVRTGSVMVSPRTVTRKRERVATRGLLGRTVTLIRLHDGGVVVRIASTPGRLATCIVHGVSYTGLCWLRHSVAS